MCPPHESQVPAASRTARNTRNARQSGRSCRQCKQKHRSRERKAPCRETRISRWVSTSRKNVFSVPPHPHPRHSYPAIVHPTKPLRSPQLSSLTPPYPAFSPSRRQFSRHTKNRSPGIPARPLPPQKSHFVPHSSPHSRHRSLSFSRLSLPTNPFRPERRWGVCLVYAVPAVAIQSHQATSR